MRSRFERFAERVTESGCWVWTGGMMWNGYGSVNVNGKTKKAHRVAYESYIGPIPPGAHVLHKCDVRACVNPAHLFLGTNKQNQADSQLKGRAAIAVLPTATIEAIKNSEGTCKQVADLVGVSTASVSRIRSGVRHHG